MNASCPEMVELSSSIFLKASLSYNLIFSIIGLYVFSWASVALWNSDYCTTFHNNLRIITQMHLFGFLLHCFGRIVLHSLDLYNYHFREPCDMIPNIYRCFVFRLMYNTGMWITTCTAIPLIFEGLMATWERAKYEKWPVVYGIFLTAIQVLVAALPLYMAYSNTKFDGVVMNYCSVYKPGHPEIAKFNGWISVAVQAIARVVFGYLFSMNKKYRESLDGKTLSARFQIVQNKSSMQCLKIYANLSTIFLFLQTGSFMLLLEAHLPPKYYLPLMELNCQFPLYGMLSVFLVARKIRLLRQQTHAEPTIETVDFEKYHQNYKEFINASLKKKNGSFIKF